MSCGTGGERISHHNHLRDALYEMAVSAGLAPTKEEQEVKKLAAALARHTGQDEDTAGRHSWGRLAMLLQRGNAAILGNRVPSFPHPNVNGVE